MATYAQITAYRPQDIDESLEAMRDALHYFHREHDQRAIFLRAYYLITIAMHAAVNRQPPYTTRLFFDVQWIRKLAGKFGALYFQSLTTDERPGERAWKTAHRLAERDQGSVLQDLLLGLNAHINYDLAYGIYLNMVEFGDNRDHLLLPRRKFDHDQVNAVLVDTMPRVEQVLTRDYGGEVLALGTLAGSFDEVLAGAGLKFYRERVWWSAVSYLSARNDEERGLVTARLDTESGQLANVLAAEANPLQRTLARFANLFSKREFGAVELERETPVPRAVPIAVAV
ncbi:MAG TPA: DUF5995 family protein [Polyangiales bacterium]|nr:DUF5995 family protein [Polyangiales bacterium]